MSVKCTPAKMFIEINVYPHIFLVVWSYSFHSRFSLIWSVNELHGVSVLKWSSQRTCDTHTCCRAFSRGAVTAWFYDLDLSRLGFEHPTFRMRGKRSNRLRHRRGNIYSIGKYCWLNLLAYLKFLRPIAWILNHKIHDAPTIFQLFKFVSLNFRLISFNFP